MRKSNKISKKRSTRKRRKWNLYKKNHKLALPVRQRNKRG